MKIIKKYLKKPSPKNLHDLRIQIRKELSILEANQKTSPILRKILKKSSKLRDSDVLLKICKSKKIKRYLKLKRKRLKDKFIKFLKNTPIKDDYIDYKIEVDCDNLLNNSFLNFNDDELHKIRIKIKKCRYSQNNDSLKSIQDILGKIHDIYNCEKLLKKFKIKNKKLLKKKQKLINKAEKIRKTLLYMRKGN